MRLRLRKCRAFTLLELIVVIIIVGILAALGLIEFTKTLEKSRSAEARRVLGSIRTAQDTYKFESGSYTAVAANLPVEFPESCDSKHYFWYSLDAVSASAKRCTAGGRFPNVGTSYTITLTYSNGVWGGTTGYY